MDGFSSSSPSCNLSLLESFLPTAPQQIFIPQQGSVPGSWLNSHSALVGLAQWHPRAPFRAVYLSFFSPHSFSLARFPAPRADNARDVTVLCQEWDSHDMALGTQTAEQAQCSTVSLLGNPLCLPHTRQNPKGIVRSGNCIKKTYLKWYPTVMQQRKNACLSPPDDSIPSRELPASKLPAQHQWVIWQHYHKAQPCLCPANLCLLPSHLGPRRGQRRPGEEKATTEQPLPSKDTRGQGCSGDEYAQGMSKIPDKAIPHWGLMSTMGFPLISQHWLLPSLPAARRQREAAQGFRQVLQQEAMLSSPHLTCFLFWTSVPMPSSQLLLNAFLINAHTLSAAQTPAGF